MLCLIPYVIAIQTDKLWFDVLHVSNIGRRFKLLRNMVLLGSWGSLGIAGTGTVRQNTCGFVVC